jgi:histone H3
MARSTQVSGKMQTPRLTRTAAKDTKLASGQVAKKKQRFRPGTLALREIRKFQESTAKLIPKLSFQRLVREIMHTNVSDMRITRTALDAIQDAAEAHVVRRLNAAYSLDCDRYRQTKKDSAKGASPMLTLKSFTFMNTFADSGECDCGPIEWINHPMPKIQRRKQTKPKKQVVKEEEPVNEAVLKPDAPTLIAPADNQETEMNNMFD